MVFPFVWAKYKWKFVRDGCKLSFRRSLARSRAARLARPNRRACSQANVIAALDRRTREKTFDTRADSHPGIVRPYNPRNLCADYLCPGYWTGESSFTILRYSSSSRTASSNAQVKGLTFHETNQVKLSSSVGSNVELRTRRTNQPTESDQKAIVAGQ